MMAKAYVPSDPSVPIPPAFLEDERSLLNAEFDAVDWLLLGVS